MAVSTTARSQHTVSSPGSGSRSALIMVTALFFMWGFLTSLNDIIIPHLKNIFSLNYTQSMLVQFTFFSAYAVFALPAGRIVEWIGYQRMMVLGLFMMGLGALMFIPAASAPSFVLFLTAQIVLAAGITVLQVAANPYVSVLGPAQTASSRLNLAQAFNSLGTTVAPYAGSLLILTATARTTDQVNALHGAALQAYRLQEAASVKVPYLVIALALCLLGITIWLYHFPRIETTRDFRPMKGEASNSIWSYPHVVLGAVAIFTYVGAEVSIGSFLANYFSQPETGGLTLQTAAKLIAFYWGGAMVGRFIGSAILQRVSTGLMVGICSLAASVLVLLSMFSYGMMAVWTILLVGLFNSILFPSIFTLGIAELGPLTGKGSGLLVAAIVGGAIVPLAEGALADRIGIHHAFILPVLCYLYIAYYGLRGSRVRMPA